MDGAAGVGAWWHSYKIPTKQVETPRSTRPGPILIAAYGKDDREIKIRLPAMAKDGFRESFRTGSETESVLRHIAWGKATGA